MGSSESPHYPDYYTDDDTNIYIEDTSSSSQLCDNSLSSSSSVSNRNLVNDKPQPVIRHVTASIDQQRTASSKSYCRTIIMIVILTAAALGSGLTLPLILIKDRGSANQSEDSDAGNIEGPDVIESFPPVDNGVVVDDDGDNNTDQTSTSEIPTNLQIVPPLQELESSPNLQIVPPLVPTMSPKPIPQPTTPSPTPLPSTSRAGQIVATISAISAVPERLEDATTSEGRAIKWMQTKDQFSTSRVVQRYATVTMVYSLNILAGGEAGGILEPAIDECSWTGISCDSDGSITAIEWSQRNRLGRLPADIGLFSSLTTLDLAENLIIGEIPEELYDLAQLKFLFLQNNLLGGTLSTRIGQLSELRKIFLGSNTLSGSLPRELGTPTGSIAARHLEWISFCNNRFNGTIPENLNLSNLYYLDLGRNYFSGPLPNDWVRGGMDNLRTMYLDHNLLSGALSNQLAQLGNGAIQQLIINDNRFTGEVPVKNFQTGFLRNFELHNNQFDKMKADICDLSIFESRDGTMSVFKADCSICVCEWFCDDGRCVE